MVYLIIGNGVAGMTAAEEIRKIDQNAEIRILSEEKYLTYYRVKLSHYIAKDFEPKELLIHDEKWYKERNIEVMLGVRVKAIDTENQKVILEDDHEVIYDKLLLANGSSAFVPPVKGNDKEGVYALRNLHDLVEIQEYLKNCKEVTVVGGGLLGLEAAWALKQRGLVVNVVEFFPYLLPRQLDPEMGEDLRRRLEALGLKIHLSAESEEIVGEEAVRVLRLKDGRTIQSDMILFSTGVRPNVEMVKNSDVKINKGIKVNDQMRTSSENVYAAGDVAEFDGVVMGLWSTASDQGKVAGQNMAGKSTTFKPVQPATVLSIGGVSMFSVGAIEREKEILSYQEGDKFYKLFIDKGKLVGGVLMGDTKKMVVLKKAVNQKKDISDLLNQNLSLLEVMEQLA